MQSAKEDREARMFRAVSYIEERLGTELDLEEVAAVTCYSRHHFQRAFLDVIGMTPAEYVLSRRLDLAVHFLCTQSRLQMDDIAAVLGFSSPSNFSRAFRKRFNLTPSEARANPRDLLPFPEGLVDASQVAIRREGGLSLFYERRRGYPGDQATVDAIYARVRAEAARLGLTREDAPSGGLVAQVVRGIPSLFPSDRLICDLGVEIRPGATLPTGEREVDERILTLPAGPYAVYRYGGEANLQIIAACWFDLFWNWLPAMRLHAAPWYGYTSLVSRDPFAAELHLPVRI